MTHSISAKQTHTKIILMGEHAVVFGEPAIAIPFGAVTVTATLTESPTDPTIDCAFYKGLLTNTPDVVASLYHLVSLLDQDLNTTDNSLALTITSTIPPERGMGSSAAVAAAVTRAYFNHFDANLDDHTLRYYLDASEKIAHGSPSGLDALMMVINHAVLFQKPDHFISIPKMPNGYLVVADSGQTSQTKTAVAMIKQKYDANDAETMASIAQIGSLVKEATHAINQEDLHTLGSLLTANHEELKKLGVSAPIMDALQEVALQQGALGAKLTGGGMGGCMIALADTNESALKIADALKALAKEVWVHPLKEDL
ncbi:mevalonate kinase [Bavariicoccus seileri]|uniref:mevalonate kinase n=1 Tax=Bavariicoccus seileri TaxID=549685 RepID=UPI003F91413C